jgi:parallel beta-helix repeat protein
MKMASLASQSREAPIPQYGEMLFILAYAKAFMSTKRDGAPLNTIKGGASCLLRRNRVYNNDSEGLYIEASAGRVTEEDNEITDNGGRAIGQIERVIARV